MTKYVGLKQRVAAGFAGAFIIVSSILLSKWSFFVVFFLISLFTQLEYYKLVRKAGYKPMEFIGIALGMALFVCMFLVEQGILIKDWYLVFLPLISISFIIKLYDKNDQNPFQSISFYCLGLIYVALPYAFLNFLVFTDYTYHFDLLIGLFILVWAHDIGAYFMGIAFGRHRLFERVSPKKTWEGSVGGVILNLIFAYVLSTVFPEISLWQWIVFGLVIVVTGTYGDLFESYFKRCINIKDSSNSIPGHGGFLDRFDGILLSTPIVVILLRLIS